MGDYMLLKITEVTAGSAICTIATYICMQSTVQCLKCEWTASMHYFLRRNDILPLKPILCYSSR